jgi:uncharacterized RDD family membrane protein YckC
MTASAIPLEQAYEGLSVRRLGAALIDFALMTAVFMVMASAFGEVGYRQHNDGTETWGIWLEGIPGLIYLVLLIGYFTLLEVLYGRTLGKALTGIKVVALEGELTLAKAAVRTLCRIVDFLPMFIPYLVGLICIGASKKRQRVGDMAAGTAVVRAHQATGPGAVLEAPRPQL